MARAVAGAGLYLTLLGLFSLAIGTMIRHTAGAVTTITKPVQGYYPLSPYAGFAVLCLWAAAALALALVMLRRRDA